MRCKNCIRVEKCKSKSNSDKIESICKNFIAKDQNTNDLAVKRNRLIELIQSAVGGCARNWAEVIADHLLNNGVTFATDINAGDKEAQP